MIACPATCGNIGNPPWPPRRLRAKQRGVVVGPSRAAHEAEEKSSKQPSDRSGIIKQCREIHLAISSGQNIFNVGKLREIRS